MNLTRFPLFFPEKRGFFLQNAGTFAVGSSQSAELFFSRRVGLVGGNAVPILGGARLTGKVAGLQVGFLNIQTDDLDRFDPVGDSTIHISPANNFGVVRLFREMENRTRLGGIVVTRVDAEATSDNNVAYAVDGALGLGEALTLDAWAAQSRTPGVSSGEYAFNGGARYVTRDWEMSAGYREVGASFNPEAGFVNRREYRHVNARILYHWRPPGTSCCREFRPHISYREFWDLGGFSETRLVSPWAHPSR